MPGNNGKLREFKGFVAESPAGFEFGNFLRRHRQMKQNLAMFSPRSEFWRPARDHALGVKNAIASLLTETFFPNPASFFQNQTRIQYPAFAPASRTGALFLGGETSTGGKFLRNPARGFPHGASKIRNSAARLAAADPQKFGRPGLRVETYVYPPARVDGGRGRHEVRAELPELPDALERHPAGNFRPRRPPHELYGLGYVGI